MTTAARLRAGSNLRLGVVARFEAGRGLGFVTELMLGPSGGGGPAKESGRSPAKESGRSPATYLFHSTAIADRSRRIEPGTAVAFVVVPAHGGAVEARELRSLPADLAREL